MPFLCLCISAVWGADPSPPKSVFIDCLYWLIGPDRQLLKRMKVTLIFYFEIGSLGRQLTRLVQPTEKHHFCTMNIATLIFLPLKKVSSWGENKRKWACLYSKGCLVSISFWTSAVAILHGCRYLKQLIGNMHGLLLRAPCYLTECKWNILIIAWSLFKKL